MNDDELSELLDRSFDDWWKVQVTKYLECTPQYMLNAEETHWRRRYCDIAKHLMEFTDKEMKNDTTN